MSTRRQSTQSTRKSTPSRALAAATLLALMAAAGCGGGGDDGDRDDQPATQESSDASREAEEPPAPTAFAKEAAFSIETGPVRYPPITLHQQNVWVADEAGLTMVDLATGDDVKRLDPERQPLHEAWEEPSGQLDEDEAAELEQQGAQRRLPQPLLTVVGGAPAVVTAVPVQGEQQDVALEILAADAETGKPLWSLLVEPAVLAGESAENLSAPVLHAHDGIAVVQVAKGDSMMGSLGIDLGSPRLAWEEEDFLAMAGTGDELAGMSFPDGGGIRLLGATLADGETTWREDISEQASIAPCGPWLAFEDFDDDQGPRLLEVATGEITHTRDDGLASGMSCWESEGGTTAVFTPDDEAEDGAIALDTASGETLWQLRPGELEGEVSASYEDRLYVEVEDGLVVRDARTGEVVSNGSGAAPQRVNGYAGLVASGNGVDVYPAER